jgi:cytochrome d ubiquinol oxidase subunit II
MVLGGLVQGIPVEGRAFAGQWDEWLSPFALLTGLALLVGYALLGATWLVLKAEGEVHRKALKFARVTAIVTLVLICVVSLWTPLLHEHFANKWFSWPELIYVVPVPLLVLVCAWSLFMGLRKGEGKQAYLSAVGLFVLSYIGLLISFFPYMVPSSVTLWDAAAPDESLRFVLVGAAFLIPIILSYTGYAYWVFRGKVGASGGYHS